MDITLLEVKLDEGEFTANAPLSFAGGVEQTDSTTADEPASDASDGQTDADDTGTGPSKRRLVVGLVVVIGAAALAYYLAGNGSATGINTDVDSS